MLRYVYEKFNIYIYAVIPTVFVAGYLVLNNGYGLYLPMTNNYKMMIGCCLLILLFSLAALMKSLPDSGKYRLLMKKYKHDQIIWRTLRLGLVASLLFILAVVTNSHLILQDSLIIIAMMETIISFCWVFVTVKNLKKTRKA